MKVFIRWREETGAEVANTPKLRDAFDQLVGPGCWCPLDGLGTFPVRFPSEDAPDDDGWHIDVSFGYEHPDFMEWRANVRSMGRALLTLMLFLFRMSMTLTHPPAFVSARVSTWPGSSHPRVRGV